GLWEAVEKEGGFPSKKISRSTLVIITGASQQLFQRLGQLTIRERLAEEAIRSLLQRFDRGGFVGPRGDQEAQHVRLDLHQVLDAFDTVHFRHRQVHRYDVRRLLAER